MDWELVKTLIAVIALLVSLFSLWQSYQARAIAVAANRAAIGVPAVKILQITETHIELELTIENHGRAAAHNLAISLLLLETSVQYSPSTIPAHNDPIEVDHLSPTTSRLVPTVLTLRPETPIADSTLLGLFVRITYTDEATRMEFKYTESFTTIIKGTATPMPYFYKGLLPMANASEAAGKDFGPSE